MRKFVFMITVFLLTVLAVNSAFGSADKNETHTYYEEVCVGKGDSYWDIAGRYDSDGMSRKEYVQFIMDFNGAEKDYIKAGQKIVVPVIRYV